MNKKKIIKRIKYSLRFLPDKTYCQLYYFFQFHKFIDYKNPKTYTEKINWLKLNDRKSEYSEMVDKYNAKIYVSNIIGNEYIIPTLGVYDKFDEIEFDKLPNQFVIKCTHDSEGLVVVKDKKIFDIKKAKEIIKEAMKYNYYYIGREYPYKNIKPRIIVEEYMEDKKYNELRDYKFFCFNGKVKVFKVDFDRFIKHRANYYDVNKNLLEIGEVVCPPDFNKTNLIPNNLSKMIKLAEILSKDLTFVRVDFYEVNNKIYFGELTLYPASGFGKFIDEKWDIIIGDWINL